MDVGLGEAKLEGSPYSHAITNGDFCYGCYARFGIFRLDGCWMARSVFTSVIEKGLVPFTISHSNICVHVGGLLDVISVISG